MCFVRHGKAEEKKPGQSDEERRLTEEGRRDVELVAKVLPVQSGVRIYTSPLKRALETAEIIARIKGGEVKVYEGLRPEVASIDTVSDVDIEGDTVFVGHAPSIERIVSEVIGGGVIKLKAGAAACVDIGSSSRLGKGVGVLFALIAPSILREALHRREEAPQR